MGRQRWPHKEIGDLVERAEAQGWVLARRRNHPVLRAPDGVTTVVLAGTSGGGRGWANMLARMRQHGYKP